MDVFFYGLAAADPTRPSTTHQHCQQHVVAGLDDASLGEIDMTTQIVSRPAIEARVRRAVARDGELLCKTRPGQTWTIGDYYTVDPHTGNPQRWHCDLEQLAREYGSLRPGEVIAE